MSAPVSTDADFLEGLNKTVAVQLDSNRTGTTTDRHANVAPNYVAVSGQSAVPCFLGIRGPVQALMDGRETNVMQWTVLTGIGYIWEPGHRLVYADASLGRNRYGYVQARTFDEEEHNHHWVTICYERVT
jgi:hypothetical protein